MLHYIKGRRDLREMALSSNKNVSLRKLTHAIRRDFSKKQTLKISLEKLSLFLLFLAQKIHCESTLEPPRRGGSNEYPQCMFWIKNKEILYSPVNPSFTI